MNIAKWPRRGLSICLYLFAPLLYGGLPEQWYASTPTTNNLKAATYGQGLIVVVGDNRTILRSVDGFNWQAGYASSSYPPGDTDRYHTIAYGNRTFFAGGESNSSFATSSDALTWTNRGESDRRYLRDVYGLIFVNGRFIGVGYDSDWYTPGDVRRWGWIFTSLDGNYFNNDQTYKRFTATPFRGIAFGGGVYVAVGDGGKIFTSTNAVDWTNRISGTVANLRAVTYTGSRFLAGGDAATLLTSIDGAAWSPAAPPSFDITGLASGDGAVAAVGTSGGAGRLHASTDGLSWPGSALQYAQPLNGVAFVSAHFMAVGNSGLLLQSDWRAAERTNRWTKSSSGNWEESYWSQGHLPSIRDSISVENAGWKALAINYPTTVNYPGTMQVLNLAVDAPVDSSNLLLMNYAGFTPLHVLQDLRIGQRGSLLNYSSALTADRMMVDGQVTFADHSSAWISEVSVGQNFPGQLTFSNADLTILRLDVGGAGHGIVNHDAGNYKIPLFHLNGNGEYNLRQGSLNVGPNSRIGASPGTCSFVMAGGTLAVSNSFYIGEPEAFGSIVVQAGAFQGGEVILQNGSFQQFAGSTVLNSMRLLDGQSYGLAYAWLYGGTLQTETMSVGYGTNYTAEFFHEGGSHTNTDSIYIDGGSSGPARYTLTSGYLETRYMYLRRGTFEQAGGTNRMFTLSAGGYVSLVGGSLQTEWEHAGGNWWDPSFVTLFAQQGGSHVVSNSLSIGPYGTFDLQGGSLSASNISVTGPNGEFHRHSVAVVNPGTFTLAGGAFFTGTGSNQLGQLQLQIGESSDSWFSLIAFESPAATVVRFKDSHDLTWGEATLYIINWAGSMAGHGSNHIYVGNSASGLSSSQLRYVIFRNPVGRPPGYYSPVLLPTGELVPATDVPETVNSWTKPSSGNWEEAYWSLGHLPALDDTAIVFTNSGYKALAIGLTTAANYPASLQIQNLLVDAPADSSNLLLLNYAGSTPLEVSSNLNIGPHGSLLSYSSVLNARSLNVSNGGSATFAQSAVLQSSNLDLGGVLVLSNAMMATETMRIDGTLNQYAGSNYVGNYRISGRGASYQLFGGVLSVELDMLEGSTFNQSGGTNRTTHLILENSGTYNLTGGTLSVSNSGIASRGAGTRAQRAQFVQTGGNHLVQNSLYVGAIYRLQGGSLVATNIGIDSDGEIRLEGGNLSNPGTLSMDFGTCVVRNGNYTFGKLRVILTGALSYFSESPRTSILDLASGNVIVRFADSHDLAADWNGSLAITNWNGAAAGGGTDRVFVGTSAQGLTASQVSRIFFVNPQGFPRANYPAQILSTGELVPAARPVMSFSRASNKLVISWPTNYSLYSAPEVTGPYYFVDRAVSPYTNSFNEARRFFQIKAN
jgi:hypothetical protein